jgi:hypothetical protein
VSGCASGTKAESSEGGAGATTTTTAGGAGGDGGVAGTGGASTSWPCGIDCATIVTDDCHVGTCNTSTGQCEVQSAADGSSCEDGLFCTVGDACEAGVCTAGPENDCGLPDEQCKEPSCNETSKTCTQLPSGNGTPCQGPSNLCVLGSTCANGLCTGGKLNDCFYAPVPDECHVAVCNPANGKCEPQPGNDGGACNDPTDPCTVGKTCLGGACTQGGKPKDCSALTQGCQLGVCDTQTGQCVPKAVGEGQGCDDLDACTTGEKCTGGKCTGGAPVTACVSGDFCCPPSCNEATDLDCASCDYSPQLFPIAYTSTNSVGDMTFDDKCNLYFSGDGGEVMRVGYNTTSLSTLYDFNDLARGIAYNENDGLLYLGVYNSFYSMSTQGSNLVKLPGNVSSFINGIEIAPTGWGSFGGQIIASHSSGNVYAVHPSTGLITVVGTTSGELSDLVFDGQNLYVAAHAQKKVLLLSPAGVFTTFATMTCSPDGVAVDEGVRVFAACGDNNQLFALAIPSGQVKLVGTAMLNGGWAPVGMIWDGLDTLLVMEEGQKVSAFTP